MFTHQSKVLGLFGCLLLAACSDNAPQSATTENKPADAPAAASAPAASGKMYTVVSQPSYPPFATRDDKGQIVGLDMDLLTEISKRQGFQLQFLPRDMSKLLDSVNIGDADIVATGVNITPERQEKFEFSKPYLEGSWIALLNKDKTPAQKWEDLKDKPIAVQSDSLSQTQLEATKITSKPIPVKTVYLGVTQVADGNAVAVYDVDSVLNTYLKPDSPYYTVVDEQSGKIPFGWVIKKGNTELKAKLDAGLDAIRADGTYQKILDKWYPKK